MYFSGTAIALCTFFIIGVFHPIVIKTEYYFGTRPWWIFLLTGIACMAGSSLPSPAWQAPPVFGPSESSSSRRNAWRKDGSRRTRRDNKHHRDWKTPYCDVQHCNAFGLSQHHPQCNHKKIKIHSRISVRRYVTFLRK